jgi:hypothetical protein
MLKPAQSDTWPATEPARPADAGQDRRAPPGARLTGLPLMVIATIQVVLSARLLGTNSAFSDEALYLWAGRLEWSGWLHHTPVPPFASYFSGAPVAYPPIAALANAVGGLAAARLLSLGFMLGATVLLHGLTRRLFDRRSANFAAALFVGLGSVQFLGALATYDAMALFLLALATWLGVRSAGVRPAGRRTALLLVAAVALVIADAAKYAATLFDPVVLVTIACFHWHALGRRAGAVAGLTATAATGAGLTAAVLAGGPSYWAGITSTTLSRAHSNWPAFGIVYASAGWVGAIVLLAGFGALATSYATRSGPARATAWTLAIAGLLAPAEQARIHVFTSLFKHVAFGAWFAAPVAGYALTAFIQAIPPAKAARALRVALSVIALSGLVGIVLVADHFGNWSNTDPVIGPLTAELQTHPGQLLVDDGPTFDYYLENVEPWPDIAAVPNSTTGQLTGQIARRRFSVILLSYTEGGGGCGNADPLVQSSQPECLHNIDIKLLSAIIGDGGYLLVDRIPYRTTAYHSTYLLWVREGARR